MAGRLSSRRSLGKVVERSIFADLGSSDGRSKLLLVELVALPTRRLNGDPAKQMVFNGNLKGIGSILAVNGQPGWRVVKGRGLLPPSQRADKRLAMLSGF